jgi:DNA polymerase-3 subunit beta
MKFTVALPDFQKALQTVLPAVPPKSTLPVLENFYFQLHDTSLQIIATDQELTIVAEVRVEGESDGAILAPARKLSDIIKALGNAGRVRFIAEEQGFKITLKTDFGQYILHGLSPEEFPSVPEFSAGATIQLSGVDAARIAKIASFAVSRDEYRPAMTGMLFECDVARLNAVTTDGYRLVKVSLEARSGEVIADKKTDVIVPVRAVDLLKKLDGDVVTMLVSQTHAKFSTPSFTVITRIIDERFPPYESVIPQGNDKIARVTLSEFIGSVKRVALFSNATTKQIRLALSANKITIVAEDQESGNKAEEEITCDYAGEEFEIGFNHRYIEEAVAHLAEDGVNAAILSFSNANRAALMKPLRDDVESEDVLMLVMPVRL